MNSPGKGQNEKIKVCPRAGKCAKLKRGNCRLKWLFPITGFVALLWFLVRVIPKPSRAAYPCQQVAGPLASGFIIWLTGVIGSFVIYHKAKQLFRKSRWVLAETCLAVALTIVWCCFVYTPAKIVLADDPVPNMPIGVAKGIYPGRVVWVHDPNATRWDGNTDSYWWEPNNTDQNAVDNMMSWAIRNLTEQNDMSQAWGSLFRYFNQTHDRGDVGYQSGEKITIKINMVACIWTADSVDPCTYQQTNFANCVTCAPQIIVSLLRQLVDEAGVNQEDIAIGDTVTLFPEHYWDYCRTEFPNVRYLDYYGYMGRTGVQPSSVRFYWSKPGLNPGSYLPDYVPQSYAQADYFINLASLKAHSAGVTLCAKNHYGSLIRYPSQSGYFDLHPDLLKDTTEWYRPLVDLMGHSHIGGKTMLYMLDGLYGGNGSIIKSARWHSYPFNNHWPSSILVSQDGVAIDSVGFDFTLAEWPSGNPAKLGTDDYLHEAALADNPPSGTFYDPDGNDVGLESLGVHEHWNNPIDKQYSRNLGTGDGIELIALPVRYNGDFDIDGDVDPIDLKLLTEHYLTSIFTIYTYEDVTTQTDDVLAYACDVDVFPFGGVMSNRNSMVEAADSEYAAIAINDTSRWETFDPGDDDEILLWLDMKVEEDINSIRQIDLTFVGSTAGFTTTHNIYVMKAETNWKHSSSWVKISGTAVPPDVDTEVTVTITSNFADYIDADTGLITWCVYQADNSSNVMRINYIQMKLKFIGAGVDVNEDDYVDMLDFAAFADNWLACQPYK